MTNKIRFSIMMFLQYAIWGAWTTALGAHLEKIGFSGTEIAGIYGCMWLACILAPFIGGQVADRLIQSQQFLGVAHLAGAFLLYQTSIQTDFAPMWWYMMAHCLLYAPTLVLTNSICFRHLGNADEEFGKIRVWGAIGWIAIGWIVTFIRTNWQTENLTGMSDLLVIAAVVSAVMGVYSFSLPKTEPIKNSQDPLAFIKAFSMLKDRNFLIFMLVAFVVTTEMQFYYIPTGPFLLDMGATEAWLTATKTVAQISEVLVLTFLLHVSIRKIGVRWTMFIGIMAWPLRYLLFMIPSLPVIVAALSLHGFGYAFFMVTGNIYTNKKATDDMRASAQALFIFATWGMGNYLGTLFTGYIWDTFRTPSGETIWWQFFLVPATLCIVMGLIFLAFFRDDPKVTEDDLKGV